MYVSDGHKHRHHETAVVEIFVFFYFFNHDNTPVSRSNHHVVGVAREDAHGATEEINHDAVDNEEYGQYAIEGNRIFGIKQPIVQGCDGNEGDTS